MTPVSTYRLSERYSFKSIWKLTLPILVALVMEELLGMTDTAFLGRVGEIELGASAIAGVYFTILYMLGFGFSIGVQIIIGRRNGEACESGKGFGAIGRVFWQGVWFLGVMALVTTVLSYFLSPLILKGILKSDKIYEAAVSYVNWRVPGLFFAFMTALFRAFYVGTRNTASLTLNSIVMVGCNILLDWVLIFGHWGAPALGIRGAALASTISEGVSLVFFVIWSVSTVDRMYGLQKMVKPVWKELKQLFSTASWVMVEYVLNVSVWLFFFLFIEHLGEEELAVANIVRSISEVPFVFSAAFASTAATLVSNIIGEGRQHAARAAGGCRDDGAAAGFLCAVPAPDYRPVHRYPFPGTGLRFHLVGDVRCNGAHPALECVSAVRRRNGGHTRLPSLRRGGPGYLLRVLCRRYRHS